MDYRIILPQLCALAGPSGFERAVAEAAAQLLAPWMDAVQIQKMGSVVGVRRCGKENAPRLVLDAHLDEDVYKRQPLIRGWNLECQSDTMTLDAVLSAQNPGLNPELIHSAFCQEYPQFRPDMVTFHRREVLDKDGTPFR